MTLQRTKGYEEGRKEDVATEWMVTERKFNLFTPQS